MREIGELRFAAKPALEMSDGQVYVLIAPPDIVHVGVCIRTDGDFDLFLSRTECEKLVSLLQTATDSVRSGSPLPDTDARTSPAEEGE